MNKAFVNNIQDVLHYYDVTGSTLTDEEMRSLDEKGYVLFERLIDAEWLGKLQQQYEYLMEQEGAKAGTEVHQEEGTRRLSDLANKGEVFDGTYIHPKILAAVYHVIGREFKVSAMNGRDAVPGFGHQDLHADWGGRMDNEPYNVAISIWMLDDFTAENGATRVVPGTHKLAGKPADYMKNLKDAHPDEIVVTAPAGSVVVLNSHTWHGGTVNHTDRTRRAIHPYYVAREFEQQQNMREYIRKSTYDRISPAARYLLNVD
ncbi:phytanoyl-CoA dioxygenase family protein [Paenibacillus solisilvae]|uniref:Phytanoyl-CoA dioxygenase family protein n=1 Tax=Paenibacillus solisilvae TaxID=2486751 RepID=A0ABW0W1C0_9BACL